MLILYVYHLLSEFTPDKARQSRIEPTPHATARLPSSPSASVFGKAGPSTVKGKTAAASIVAGQSAEHFVVSNKRSEDKPLASTSKEAQGEAGAKVSMGGSQSLGPRPLMSGLQHQYEWWDDSDTDEEGRGGSTSAVASKRVDHESLKNGVCLSYALTLLVVVHRSVSYVFRLCTD